MDDKTILSKFPNTRMNKENLLLVYRTFEANPTKTINEIKTITGLTSSFWIYYRSLRDAGCLTHEEDFNREMYFYHYRSIKNGEYQNGKYTALANHLSRYGEDETPVGFTMTKKEILLRLQLEIDPIWVKGSQELLAIGSLFNKDLRAFSHMKDVTPVTQEDFKWT